MKRLPFQDTTVSVAKSIAQIEDMLIGVGFSDIYLINKAGVRSIHAAVENIQFSFKIYPEEIIKKLIESASDRRQYQIRHKTEYGKAILEEFEGRASRIGWRLMHEHAKSTCDAIKVGVMKIMDGFAGQLYLPDTNGNLMTLSDHLVTSISTGKLILPGMNSTLLLNSPKKE